MGRTRHALSLEQKHNIVNFMSENPLMSQRDVGRVFSRKYGQTVTKGVIYRITKNREKLSKPEKKENRKKKFREVPIRFPCFEEYVREELRGVPTKKRKVVIK